MLFKFWGKAQQSHGEAFHQLAFHCLDCAAVVATLLERDPLLLKRLADLLGLAPPAARCFTVFWACIHDLGKFSPAFQAKVPELMRRLQGEGWASSSTWHHTKLALLAWRWWLRHLWLEKGWYGICRAEDVERLEKSWVQAGFAHHGRGEEVSTRPGKKEFDRLFPADCLAAMDELVSWAGRRLAADQGVFRQVTGDEMGSRLARSSWLAAGIIVAGDWLASNQDFFPWRGRARDLDQYWDLAVDQAEKALAQSGILPAVVASFHGVGDLFDYIREPTPMQAWAAGCRLPPGPKLIILEESTGAGKTEAALVLAQRVMAAGEAESLLVGLPTMATANAMYSRLARCYRRLFGRQADPSLALAHSRRRLHRQFNASVRLGGRRLVSPAAGDEPESAAQCAAWLAQGNKRSLLASLGVGTVDQLLLAALPVRHQCLRLLGLGRAVVIIDEVHAYDTYVNGLLAEGLLPYLASVGQTVIMLSATLNRRLRQRLARGFSRGLGAPGPELASRAYPLATLVSREGALQEPLATRAGRRTAFTVQMEDDPQRLQQEIGRAVDAGGCVCWVRNTVDDARESYRDLCRRLGDERVGLLHARMALCDRLDWEQEVLECFGPASRAEDRAGRVLVATQVVEQSLDLDFDLMISDLAPVDLLVQRAGRLHRHSRDSRPLAEPRLVVHGPLPVDDPPEDWLKDFFARGAWVYQRHGLLWLTARALAQRARVRLPQDVRELVERVYLEDQPPPGLMVWEERAEGADQAAGFQARDNILRWEDGYGAELNSWTEDTPTRLSQPVTHLYLGRWQDGRLRPWSGQDGWPAWELSQVSLNRRQVARAAEPGDGDLARAVAGVLERYPWLAEAGNALVPLERQADGPWQGQALDPRGRPVTLVYDSNHGLGVTPG